MRKSLVKFIFLASLVCYGCAQDSLILNNQKQREPTTKRPSTASAQDDELDDTSEQDNQDIGIRHNLYSSTMYNREQITNSNNGIVSGQAGILVGPGGPTGIIGRPQQQYPVLSIGMPFWVGARFSTQVGQGNFPEQGPILGFKRGSGGPQYIHGINGIGEFHEAQFPQSHIHLQNGNFPTNEQFQRYYFTGKYTAHPYSDTQYMSIQHSGGNDPIAYGSYSHGGNLYDDGYTIFHSNDSPVGQQSTIKRFNIVGNVYALQNDDSDTTKTK